MTGWPGWVMGISMRPLKRKSREPALNRVRAAMASVPGTVT
jgi:hypothetical protein